ncbi:MAG: hemerythrin family protein [Pirellulales bacterium]|nr:hemerythrin family protein [Pirellulales bacterium]
MTGQTDTGCPTLIQWQPYYSVGNRYLDNQHRQIISLVNRTYQSILLGEEKETLRTVMRRLVDYVDHHFHDEEILMQKHDFPGLESHRAEHSRLTKDTHDLQRACLQDDSPSAQEVLSFLKQWFLTHVIGDDKQYASYLSEDEVPVEVSASAPKAEAFSTAEVLERFRKEQEDPTDDE